MSHVNIFFDKQGKKKKPKIEPSPYSLVKGTLIASASSEALNAAGGAGSSTHLSSWFAPNLAKWSALQIPITSKQVPYRPNQSNIAVGGGHLRLLHKVDGEEGVRVADQIPHPESQAKDKPRSKAASSARRLSEMPMEP